MDRWRCGAEFDLEWYLTEVQPKLAIISLPAIARATGASTSAASQWRSGKGCRTGGIGWLWVT